MPIFQKVHELAMYKRRNVLDGDLKVGAVGEVKLGRVFETVLLPTLQTRWLILVFVVVWAVWRASLVAEVHTTQGGVPLPVGRVAAPWLFWWLRMVTWSFGTAAVVAWCFVAGVCASPRFCSVKVRRVVGLMEVRGWTTWFQVAWRFVWAFCAAACCLAPCWIGT